MCGAFTFPAKAKVFANRGAPRKSVIFLARAIYFKNFLQFDFDVYARGKVNAVQQLRIGAVDVDDPLVRADLELLAAVLVLVRRAENGDDLLFGGQRDGAAGSPFRWAEGWGR